MTTQEVLEETLVKLNAAKGKILKLQEELADAIDHLRNVLPMATKYVKKHPGLNRAQKIQDAEHWLNAEKEENVDDVDLKDLDL